MNNINIVYKEVLSIDFYSSKNGYSGASLVLKSEEGNRVYVRYEWESDSVNDIPLEVVEFLANNGLDLNTSNE